MKSVGILGLGAYLPPIIRGNDWWPASIVDDWRARQQRRFTNFEETASLTPGVRLVLAATQKYAGDPFEGAVERRVTPDDVRSSDMGVAAAKDAMERAGVGPKDIDFLLVQSMVPDYLNSPDGCRIHDLLGLPGRTFTTSVEASCAGFLQQLTLSQGLITAGVGKRGLTIQCSPMSRILRQADPWSAAFGDGATAQVVGEVREGYGILAQAHATDGATHGGLVTGVPGGRWHDAGAAYMYVENNDRARNMVMSIPDAIRQLMDVTLGEAHLERDQVDFIAAHQATIWFGEVMQEVMEMKRARRVNTFTWTTSLSGANLPFAMAMGERDGLLKSGDNVVMFSGATGMTAGTMALRYGN